MKTFKRRLFTPGPTPLPPSVQNALSRPVLYHRSEEFREIFVGTLQRLKRLMRTNGEVVILTSSGTGAMESAVSNFFGEGDKVLVIVGGKFGKRWLEIAKLYGLEPIVIEVEWGRAVDPEEVRRAVKQYSPAGILTQICETSTGTVYDIKAIGEISKEFGVILVADGITAYGVYDIPTDEWGIDIAITGSQKALMTPPGLAVVCVGKECLEKLKPSRSYYFDLQKEISQQRKGQTAYTVSTTLVVALNEALKLIEEEGLENTAKRHEVLAECARKGISSLGLELFSERPANGLTAVKCPEGLDCKKLVSCMKEKGMTIAGGQDHLKGKIFRISHMGYVDVFDLVEVFSALEICLYQLGYRKFTLGTSLRAILETYYSLAL